MRDTARLQCLALLLLGAFAWMSLDVGSLRATLAGVLNPEAAEAPAEAPDLDLPEPILSKDLPPRRPFRFEFRKRGRHVWVAGPGSNAGIS